MIRLRLVTLSTGVSPILMVGSDRIRHGIHRRADALFAEGCEIVENLFLIAGGAMDGGKIPSHCFQHFVVDEVAATLDLAEIKLAVVGR